ncbi:hypothetical protein LCGC14_1617500, partial [marine sediment metagenome]
TFIFIIGTSYMGFKYTLSPTSNLRCDFNKNKFIRSELITATALLHDIGHYHLSHSGENIFNDYICISGFLKKLIFPYFFL